jgi:hypothetical protein
MPLPAALAEEFHASASLDTRGAITNLDIETLSAGNAGHAVSYGDDDNEREDDGHGDDDDDEREKDDDDDNKRGKARDDDKDNDLKKGRDNPGKDKGKGKGHDGKGGNDDDNHSDEQSAHPQSVATKEDTPVKIVLEGSSGRDGGTRVFLIVAEPQHGELGMLETLNDTVVYFPSENYFGRDSFEFTVGNGNVQSRPATVTIEVIAVNDPPVAADLQLGVREDRSTSFVLRATDVDDDELGYEVISGPAHGDLVGDAPDLLYEPDRNFRGSDSVTFKANDGKADSNLATVSISVRAERTNNDSNEVPWWLKVPATTTPVVEEIDSADELEVSGNEGILVDAGQAGPAPLTESTGPLPVILDSSVEMAQNPIQEVSFLPVDSFAPRLVFPAEKLEAVATSVAGTVVTYAVKAVDDTDGEIVASCSPESGYKFQVGKFNVVCWAADAAGNSALGSFVVVVSQAPSAGGTPSALLVSAVIASVLGAGAYLGHRVLKRTGKL